MSAPADRRCEDARSAVSAMRPFPVMHSYSKAKKRMPSHGRNGWPVGQTGPAGFGARLAISCPSLRPCTLATTRPISVIRVVALFARKLPLVQPKGRWQLRAPSQSIRVSSVVPENCRSVSGSGRATLKLSGRSTTDRSNGQLCRNPTSCVCQTGMTYCQSADVINGLAT